MYRSCCAIGSLLYDYQLDAFVVGFFYLPLFVFHIFGCLWLLPLLPLIGLYHAFSWSVISMPLALAVISVFFISVIPLRRSQRQTATGTMPLFPLMPLFVPLLLPHNAADERAFVCVLDPFVIAPLFSLFCALNTGSSHVFYALLFYPQRYRRHSSFYICCFHYCLLFLSAHWRSPVRCTHMSACFLRRHFIVFIYLRSGAALAAHAHCLR